MLNKIDLLPHVPFDLDAAVANARQVNPELAFFFTSALTGEAWTSGSTFCASRLRAMGTRQ